MKVEILVPSVGESVVEGSVSTILKPNGSQVTVDEEILEIETDKVTQPLYAPATGQLHLTVQVADVVKIGQVIGFIDTGVTGTPAPSKEVASAPSRQVVDSPQKENPPSSSRTEGVTRKKMTKLRRTIAERLVQVKNQTAMLTTFNEVDLSSVLSLREREQERFQKKYGVKLGLMSFFVKACISALKAYPELNARIEGDDIVLSLSYDIGIAVGTDKGLLVPVLRRADHLTSAEIEQRLKEVAAKAREGTISVDDLQGGTFTITNGGVYGSMLSTPILNPPQSGILGMHAIIKRPVVVDDQIVIRPMMYLALSYDHRLVDGQQSIGFLVHIKKILEDPMELHVEG